MWDLRAPAGPLKPLGGRQACGPSYRAHVRSATSKGTAQPLYPNLIFSRPISNCIFVFTLDDDSAQQRPSSVALPLLRELDVRNRQVRRTLRTYGDVLILHVLQALPMRYGVLFVGHWRQEWGQSPFTPSPRLSVAPEVSRGRFPRIVAPFSAHYGRYLVLAPNPYPEDLREAIRRCILS